MRFSLLVSLPRVQIFSSRFVDTAVCIEIINCLNTNININFIWRYSPYRAVNTLRLSYKNQPVNVV
jgi:hypothetical protein